MSFVCQIGAEVTCLLAGLLPYASASRLNTQDLQDGGHGLVIGVGFSIGQLYDGIEVGDAGSITCIPQRRKAAISEDIPVGLGILYLGPVLYDEQGAVEIVIGSPYTSAVNFCAAVSR